LVKKDVQKIGKGGAYLNLSSARRIAQNQDEIVFDTVINEGIKRLGDNGIVEAATLPAIARIRNTSRKSAKKLACVKDFNALPDNLKIKHNASMAIFGMLSEVTKPKKIANLESRVYDTARTISLAETLDAFK
jgi:hypothetical protein